MKISEIVKKEEDNKDIVLHKEVYLFELK